MAKSRSKAEYGDFQTPLWLAERVCARLAKLGVAPAAVVEPTCGAGAFLLAAAHTFQPAARLVGVDINPLYVDTAQAALQSETRNGGQQLDLRCGNFFALDWQGLLVGLPHPLLILGNPPWVTNTELSALNSANQPPKSNFQRKAGIDAITGASNFDVSEWMLVKLLEWADSAITTLAMLCKTAVARKVLAQAWREGRKLGECRIYAIDAQRAFGATVDACLLYIGSNTQSAGCQTCAVYADLDAEEPSAQIALRSHVLVADVQKYERWQHLSLPTTPPRSSSIWRSGIKHDCSPVMELVRCAEGYQNGLGETVQLESDLLFPLYKATDLAHGRQRLDRWLIVTQSQVGMDTNPLRWQTPLTWQYLDAHNALLEKRRSTIYRGQPRFAIFGVGDYSFTPWKVAISGLHKSLQFVVLGPVEDKPAVLDDTCYFLSCATQREAELVAELLNTSTARAFFEAYIFWNDKRPVTARLLRRLNLVMLAHELGRASEYAAAGSLYARSSAVSSGEQLRLLERKTDTL